MTYAGYSLTLGNLRNDDRFLSEAEGLLGTIKEGFSEALKQVSSAVVSDHSPSYQTQFQKSFSIAA